MTKLFLIIVQLFCSINILSQPSFNLLSGYGKTVFESAAAQAEFLPAGIQLMFGVPVFNFGIEVNYSMTPIVYDVHDFHTKENSKQIKINQLFIGSVIKVNLAAGYIIPYIRLGAGLYTGKERVSWYAEAKKKALDNGVTLDDYKTSLKNRPGFNIGGGFNYRLWRYSGFFVEYAYHFLSTRENISGSALMKADSWTFSFGYQFNFL